MGKTNRACQVKIATIYLKTKRSKQNSYWIKLKNENS